MDTTKRAYLELHIAVLLFGFTAILGNLIQLSAVVLVWWRVLLASLVFLIFTKAASQIRLIPRRFFWKFVGIGFLVTLHWLAFYGSIKLANASVTLICMATTSFQSALLEPLIMRQPIKWYEVGIGIIIVPAMMFIANDLPSNMTAGLIAGILASVLAVTFSILNKKYIHEAAPLSISLLELGSSCLFLTLFLPVYFYFDKTAVLMPSPTDWIYLLVLAVLCTNIGYLLGTRSLKHLSAFASNLTLNLEPIYGIILAVLILKENKELPPSFYIGSATILIAVLIYPFLKKRFDNDSIPINISD
jgi:drug/metabolite transporter (DMT)-like permease